MNNIVGYLTDRFVLYVLAGILGVLNMIIWGVYGDLLVEKFKITKILRSLFLGVSYSILIFINNPMLPLFIVALCTISLERATTEIYKPLLRKEKQDKYRIRSDLNISFPRPVGKILGFVLISLLLMFFLFVNWQWNFSKVWLAVITGFIVAIGGMLKDAPKEGFNIVTFFRSPLYATVFGIFLFMVFPNIQAKYYIFAVAGGERIFSEWYKKILNGREPGKFKKQLYVKKSWKNGRWTLMPVYALDLALIFLLIFVK